MSKFLSKIRVKTGSQSQLNRFDFSSNTYTTQDFFKMKPVYFKELMPGEKFKMNSIQCFTRLSPLVNPMYGNINIVTRSFFVPYRLVMEGFNEFLTSTPYFFDAGNSGTIINKVSVVKNDYICQMFKDHISTAISESDVNEWADLLYSVSGTTRYDIQLEVSGHTQYYRFTQFGKLIIDILNGLGYRVNFCLADYNDVEWSALPLLAYAKIFVDWYNNPAYVNYTSFSAFFRGKNRELPAEDLYEIFSGIKRVMFDKDYFTSAWDNPTSPNNGVGVGISIPDNTNNAPTYQDMYKNKVSSANVPSGNASSTPSISIQAVPDGQQGTSNMNNITQFVLDALKHVQDYVSRHQFVGSRVLDRYFAEWGLKLDSAKLNRSLVIGKSSTQINISDVMQTSTDYDSNDGVGNYAGKGLGYSNDGQFDFEADEFGVLIVTSYVMYKNSYVDGCDRYLQHKTKFDFFHGEFDSLGVQAIRQDELCSGFNLGQSDFKPDAVFGYTPRYAEYCVKQDNLLGDFRIRSRNASLQGWNLLRRFTPTTESDQTEYENIKHGIDFTLGDPARNMDIFVDTNTYFDHFITIFRFDATSYMPKRPLYDCLDFHSDGKDIDMSINGVTLTD